MIDYLPYDIDHNGIADTPRSREFIGRSLKNVYEGWWRVGEERGALDDMAERIIGQRIFGYSSHPVSKLSALLKAWTGHMEAKYTKLKEG